MADLKKIVNKLKEEHNLDLSEISAEELEELEGGAQVACNPQNSSCPTTTNAGCL